MQPLALNLSFEVHIRPLQDSSRKTAISTEVHHSMILGDMLEDLYDDDNDNCCDDNMDFDFNDDLKLLDESKLGQLSPKDLLRIMLGI